MNNLVNIKSTLLQLLCNTPAHYMQPEHSLIAEAQRMVIPEPSCAEVRAALKFLDTAGYITGVRSTYDDLMRWQITDLGRAQYNQL